MYVGVDGGGTRTTVAVADSQGREIVRRVGPAGLVDPRHPATSARTVLDLVRETLDAAGVGGRATVLCAGLAGVASTMEREVVRAVLETSGVAERVVVHTDGEVALEGALAGGPGVLLIAGTGSVAYGRGEDGRVERCGGWGTLVGDEGSAFWIARTALHEGLRGEDGRGPESGLLAALLDAASLTGPREIPPWLTRSAKSEIASVAPVVSRLAQEGDPIAASVLERGARELAQHVAALVRRLGPWAEGPDVVLHGGVLRSGAMSECFREALAHLVPEARIQPAAADAAAGALRIAVAAHQRSSETA